ncbi:MAG: hypothetical protein WBG19_01675 [Thermoplasmata archaeon]
MSLLVTASERIKATTSGLTSAAPAAASGPHAEPVHAFTTDLGNLEHLFTGAGFVQNASERVSTALTRATDSVRGPNGGLIPSALQHAAAAGITRVDGQQLMAVEARAATQWQILTARVRSMLGGARG